MISELGERESRELLNVNRLGRLGCCLNDTPYVVPVNYLLEGDYLYIHSLPGRKIDILRVNPHACLQVDEIKDCYNWRSVMAYGRYEEVTESHERERVLAKLFRRLPHLSPVESKMTRNGPPAMVFRLRIVSITGRAERLPWADYDPSKGKAHVRRDQT